MMMAIISLSTRITHSLTKQLEENCGKIPFYALGDEATPPELPSPRPLPTDTQAYYFLLVSQSVRFQKRRKEYPYFELSSRGSVKEELYK